jgi:aspartate/methionine/tyrosine aminotransferase
MKLASRIDRLRIESAFDVLVRARALEAQGRSIIHLEIGEPDFPTPAHIVEAAKKALDDGYTHYGPTQGLPELREAIADHVSKTRGIAAKASQVCVVPGGKPIIFFPMMALLEPGDEVVFPDPGFPIYESMIRFLECVPVPLDPMDPKITDRTKMVILNSPENPTGEVLSGAVLERIAEQVRERDCMVLSDEIYSRIYYGDAPGSIASLPGMQEKTIILDGFSKTYAMTGWRIGYGVMPEWLVEAVNKLMVNSNSCTAMFTQRAALAALTGPQDEVVKMVAEFHKRRDAFCGALNQIQGFDCPIPGGAFYAWPDITGTGKSSKELADLLLNEAGVACLNGASFGTRGEGRIRFSYANSLGNLLEAAERMRRWLSLSL